MDNDKEQKDVIAPKKDFSLSGFFDKVKSAVKKVVAKTLKKVGEEAEQFNDMGGWSNAGKYVTQNLTSLGVKAAKGVGADELAKDIESKRDDVLAVGKAVDDKIKEGKAKLKAELTEQKGAPVQPTCPAQVRFAMRVNKHTKISPLYDNISKTIVHEDWKSIESSLTQFKKADIKDSSTPDGQSINVTLLDGKKHGFEIVRDANGNITNVAAYDHGKKIDLSQHKVEFRTEERDGTLMECATLDGQIFGTQTLVDKDGNAKVAFYDKDGKIILNTDESQIAYTTGKAPDNQVLLAATQQKQR